MRRLYIFIIMLGILITGGACNQISTKGVVPTPSDTPRQTTKPTNSGIYGQTLLGPTCPGPIRPEATECADRPYQVKINILNEKGQLIQQFETDMDGQFRISLEPGIYTLHPELKGLYPSAGDQTVEVLPNQFIEVIIIFDTGIR
jgi:hypothetical protein